MKRDKTAIIDIGSNSIRLMFADNEALNKKQLYSTVLAEGLQKTGKLNAKAMDRTIDAIGECLEKARQHGVENIYAFATEAVRSASNGKEFADIIKDKYGLSVDVISGKDEARLGFLGASIILPKPITVIDIGGASVEIVNGNENINYAVSLPLGVVRLKDLFGNDIEALKLYLSKEIKKYREVPSAPLIGIGGTATALSAMNLGLTEYDENKVNGSVLTIEELTALKSRIFASDNLLRDFPTLTENRAKVIGQGAILLIALIEYLDREKITISEYDNMEGYIVYKNI